MLSPTIEFTEDLVAQQRAAIVIYHLGVLGKKYTTSEIATLTGITHGGAARLMDKLSCVLPILKLDGKWMVLVGG